MHNIFYKFSSLKCNKPFLLLYNLNFSEINKKKKCIEQCMYGVDLKKKTPLKHQIGQKNINYKKFFFLIFV